MKLEYNEKQFYELSEVQKKVIKNDIIAEDFDADMVRRCKYWLESPIEKFAHANKDKLIKELIGKGHKNVPLRLEKLAEKHAEEFPCPCGYTDINNPVICKVGDQSFQLMPEYRKSWRKMGEKRQELLEPEAYLKEEEEMLCSRMAWILQHKYERCFERLKLEWIPKLQARGVKEVPADDDLFAELVFSQPDYKDRDARDAEEELSLERS